MLRGLYTGNAFGAQSPLSPFILWRGGNRSMLPIETMEHNSPYPPGLVFVCRVAQRCEIVTCNAFIHFF